MGFVLLVLGIALWWGAHAFKRLMPVQRAAMGDKGKGLVALGVVAGIVLMVIGFRAAPYVHIWSPPSFTIHINNLLVLIAIFLMSPAPAKGRLFNKLRHPMLGGFRAWAFAHLLVNGDLASIILFGGLFAWALVAQKQINAAEPDWPGRAPGSWAKDAMFLVASLILMAIIGYVHGWLGYWPFPS